MRSQISFGIALLCLASGCASCVQIPDVEGCTVAGLIEAGADCATSNTGIKRKLTAKELLEMIEPVADQPKEGIKGRAGAVIISAKDYKRMKDAQEMACRELGNRCTYEGSK